MVITFMFQVRYTHLNIINTANHFPYLFHFLKFNGNEFYDILFQWVLTSKYTEQNTDVANLTEINGKTWNYLIASTYLDPDTRRWTDRPEFETQPR